MDESKYVPPIRTISIFSSAMKKLAVNPNSLTIDEQTYLLASAIIFMKKYEKDNRFTTYVELAYYIVLNYSLNSGDYEPLYDFSINMGFYPVAQAITEEELLEFNNIPFSLLSDKINEKFSKEGIIETLEQKTARANILQANEKNISFIAPTSFGKSNVILEHILSQKNSIQKIGIIVPTKSLLMQTYRMIKNANINIKLLIHDEMYGGEEQFIGIFTQERALRLLERNDIFFNTLYIDEAHELLERDARAILLSRLIKMNQNRNSHAKTLYFSPLIDNSDNLKMRSEQKIFEQKVNFNVKEPNYFEYRLDGSVFKYDRFVNAFYPIDKSRDIFEYILEHRTLKTFFYLYSPRKIEMFAQKLAEKCEPIISTSDIKEIIFNLKKYVHEDFFAIDYLKKGIIYLHGKIPDNIKEYLEYKFYQSSEITMLIANKVILEGINLPIDSLFILNTNNLKGKELTNLIGRVNRLDQVFKKDNNDLSKLVPSVHFVNSEVYNRQRSKMQNKIKLLKSSTFSDTVNNPLLYKFNFDQLGSIKKKEECQKIISREKIIFSETKKQNKLLEKKMIALGINAIYNITDELCDEIDTRIQQMLKKFNLDEIHFLDKLKMIFVNELEENITDKEFSRLKNEQAIAYYKMFFENRKKSLKENITNEIIYFQSKAASTNSLLYIGQSYGEIPYETTGREFYSNVYIDLKTKNKQELANIAIIKQKIEEDFIGYKLHMFLQLMFDYSILSQEEYNTILYGTNNKKKLQLVKMGLTINIINRLDEDKQLKNISIDANNNLYTNVEFEKYKQSKDDFYRFELNKFL